MNIQEIIAQIIEGNNNFIKSHNKDYFESFRTEQRPFITLVTCSDSRVTLNALLSDTSNKIFSIQNIGNQILSAEGSVDYGIYHLKTPMLMFLGHSDCGAIKAFLNGYERESPGIKHELDFLKPIINDTKNDPDFSKVHNNAIEKNLDYQVAVACNKYRELISTGKLTVIAGFYDFKGDFDRGQGTIIIVNVNQEKNVGEMYNISVFKNLTIWEKDLHLGRLSE